MSKLEKQINWIMVEPRSSAFNKGDSVTVHFSKLNEKTGSRQTTIRIGNEIMEEMGWTLEDKLGIYHSDTDPYYWMVCKAANGYKLRQEEHNKATTCFQFMWRKEGVNFNRAKSVDFECQTDKIVFEIPLDN